MVKQIKKTGQKKIAFDVERRAEIGRQKRAKTLEKILTATFSIIGQQKGQFASTDEICREASISRGTFYNYFNNIEELFESLSHNLSHDFNSAVTTAIDELEGFSRRSSAAVRLFLEKAKQDRQWGWAMVHISSAGFIFGSEVSEYAMNTLQSGIDTGEFTIKNAEIGTNILLGTTLAAMTTIVNEREPQDSTHIEHIAYAILLGLGVERDLAEKIANEPLPKI